MIHCRRGELDQAEREFLALVEARPDDVTGLRELAAVVAIDRDRRPEAIELLRRAHALDPGDVETRLLLGRVLAWCGRYGEARAELRQVERTSSDPGLVRKARIEIANTFAWSGAPHAAFDRYEQVLAEGRGADALRELANLETWRGRPGHAFDLYAECGETTGDPLADHRKERARCSLGRFAEGAAQFFTDSQRWRRVKLRTDWLLRTEGDSELTLGLEGAWYRDGAGDEAARELFLARYVKHATPFTTLAAEVGAGVVEGGEGDWIGGVAWSSTVRDGTDLAARYRHDDLADEGSPFEFQRYSIVQSIGALEDEHLQIDSLEVNAGQRIAPWTALDAFVRWSAISDGNERLERYFALRQRLWQAERSRGFVRAWYWVEDFDQSEPLYYSPSTVESYGLSARAEGGSEYAPWFIEAGPYYQPGSIEEWGWQAEAGARRRPYRGFSWSLGVNHFESGERGGSYEATALIAELGWRL